ncbi:MAG: radical SAM protein [Phycisphaerales bacterium]|nr:radical SAM protein [Phycisphaerales bacterium]
MRCPHCDLPVYEKSREKFLSPDEWELLLNRTMPAAKPEVVALVAKEPLIDDKSRAISRRVLETAKKQGSRCGLVSNGSGLDEFFQAIDSSFHFDYMDLSLEGTQEVDRKSRGPGHFEKIERFLDQGNYRQHLDSLFLSTVMTAANSSDRQLTDYFAWIFDHMETPNLALLLLYPKAIILELFSLARSVLEPRMAMRGFGSRFLRMSSRHDHMKNALNPTIRTFFVLHQKRVMCFTGFPNTSIGI